MSTSIQLFSIGESVKHLSGSAVLVEKELQWIVEKNMEEFFSVTFLGSEYSTGQVHRGRIDSLGIDDTNSPVIFEYKRQMNENVINQGLFYLDWLLDHQAEFELLVMRKLGNEKAEKIDWNGARLICIANDFTRYDEHAVRQISRNIQLVRYLKYDNDLLLFELVNATSGQAPATPKICEDSQGKTKKTTGVRKMKTAVENLEAASGEIRELFSALKDYVLSLGQDISYKEGLDQFVFKRFRNFACVEVHPRDSEILIYLKIDPSTVVMESGFSRDMRKIGHWGTGDLELRIRNEEQLEKVKPLIMQSYEAS
jgi:predicted transport protein